VTSLEPFFITEPRRGWAKQLAEKEEKKGQEKERFLRKFDQTAYSKKRKAICLVELFHGTLLKGLHMFSS
jgi:hypothetical protein